MLLLLFWFPVLLEFLWIYFARTDWAYTNIPEGAANLLSIIPELLFAPALVATFRMFVLGQSPVFKTFSLRRDPGRAPWLNIPFYFKYGRAELVYALLNIGLLWLHRGSNHLFGQWWIQRYKDSGEPFDAMFDAMNDPLRYYPYLLIFLVTLLSAALILWWPYIATQAEYSLQKLRVLARATRGNVFRIFLVITLIYTPAAAFNQLWPWASYIFGMYSLSNEGVDALWSITSVVLGQVSRLITISCMIVDVAFAALLWNSSLNPLKAKAS